MIFKPPGSSFLTDVDAACAWLSRGVEPVAAVSVSLEAAAGAIASGETLRDGVPERAEAAQDGYALRALDLVGASAYSPVPLTRPLVPVLVGDPLPGDCDCVVSPEQLDLSGPIPFALVEALPGENVDAAGRDGEPGSCLIAPGQTLGALELLMARRAGLAQLSVRRPRVSVLATGASPGPVAAFLAQAATARGATVRLERSGTLRDSIAEAIAPARADMIITVGGIGRAPGDATLEALAEAGAERLTQGLALVPGRNAAFAKLSQTPVLAVPDTSEAALAVWWTLARPVLDRLSGKRPRPALALPLTRKIASQPGLSDIALLAQANGRFEPLCVGALPFTLLAQATAFARIPMSSEGYGAGEVVHAFPLEEVS